MDAHLIQGTTEWILWKKSKISGTDASKILNINPWSSPLALWEEKLSLREPQKMNSNMQRGIDTEPIARDIFNKLHGSVFEPVVLEHKKESWAIASLDGMNSNNEIIEIKANGQKNHQLALDGIIPDYYLCQIQHCLWVSGADICYYFSYTPESQKVIEVKPDLEFIEKMIEAEKAFYKCLIDFTPPPATDKDYIVKDDGAWFFMANEWKRTKAMLKELEAREEEERQALIAMCDGQSSMGAGVKISKCIKKGNVVYKNIPELASIDLEIYRSKPSTYYRISDGA